MTINHGILRTDILARPALSGQIEVGDDAGISNFYNTPQDGVNTNEVTITNDSVLRWSAVGPYSKLYDAVDNSGLTHGVRSRAATLLRLIDSFASVDVSSGAISGVVANLATNGIITNAERDNFLGLVVKTKSTPGEFLFGVGTNITINDVSLALRGQ